MIYLQFELIGSIDLLIQNMKCKTLLCHTIYILSIDLMKILQCKSVQVSK